MNENIFEKAIMQWRDNKGQGIVIIPPPFDERIIILGILERIYAYTPNTKTIIISDSFDDRTKLVEFLTHSSNEDNNKEFKQLLSNGLIKAFTTQFVQGLKTYDFRLCILYKVYSCPIYIEQLMSSCVFRLIVNTKLADNDTMSKFNCIVPALTEFNQTVVDEVRTSSPVEEIGIGVPLPESSGDAIKLKECNEYIQTSINIFGSFDIMQQARIGNKQLNLSAADICNRISAENDWSTNLDMSIEYNCRIDEVYNPNSLRERASNTYNIIRERRNLLASSDYKLDAILRIVQENIDKRILIINGFSDFATKVSEYINGHIGKTICMPYHDKLIPIEAVDVDGNPIYIKSGAKKGERKMMADKAQRTLANARFLHNKINVISTNASPDKDLCIDVDIVIITSPFCETIANYKYRLSDCVFSNNLHCYTIYITNSIESKQLPANFNKMTCANDDTENNFDNDEKNIDFSIVD